MAKLPSFTFYPGDWLRNDVAGCSLEAQGLWLRMMIVMHDAEVYGELSVNGKPMPDEFVAKKCGVSATKYRKYLRELEDFSVINRKKNELFCDKNCEKNEDFCSEKCRKNSIIFSGRMKRDEQRRQQNAERQRRFYEEHKDEPNAEPNAQPNTPSSSSSSFSSSEEKKEEGKKPPVSDLEKDLLILKTESVLNLKLLLDEKRLVVDAIPPAFTEDWGTYLKARMLKLDKKASRNAIISAMGYAVTDYRRDNKFAYEKLNRPQPKLPTLAEKIAEEERHRDAPKNDPAKFLPGMPAAGHLDSNSIR